MSVKIDFNSNQEIPVIYKKVKKPRQKKEKQLPQDVNEITEVAPDNIIGQIKILKEKIKHKRSVLKNEKEEKGINKIISELSVLVKQKNTLMEQLLE
jgi:hypothetical protein